MGFFTAPAVFLREPQPEDVLLYAPEGGVVDAERHDDYLVPVAVPWRGLLGRGPEAQVRLAGVKVRRGSVTFELVLHMTRFRAGDGQQVRPDGDAGGLRVGVLKSDSTRATTLDPEGSGSELQHVFVQQPGFDLFKEFLTLRLSPLPPSGPLTLVVAWPAEGVPETATTFDAAELQAAATEIEELWEELPEVPATQKSVIIGGFMGNSTHLEPRSRPKPAYLREPVKPVPVFRADWKGVDWRNTEDVRLRLEAGADPESPTGGWPVGSTPLHHVAEAGNAESLRELIALVGEVDPVDEEGLTPLWHAVLEGREEAVRMLAEEGADPWTPRVRDRSPGHVALGQPQLMQHLENHKGAVRFTAAEAAAQAEADARIVVFQQGFRVEGMAVAFVAGIDSEEVIRRLGQDPEDWPPYVHDPACDPFHFGSLPPGLSWEDGVGLHDVADGCVLTQLHGYRISSAEDLRPLSVGTTAYGFYDCSEKGYDCGALLTDGKTVWSGIHTESDDFDLLPGVWKHRLIDGFGHLGDWNARLLAYGSAITGVHIPDPAVLGGPPDRWVRLPEQRWE